MAKPQTQVADEAETSPRRITAIEEALAHIGTIAEDFERLRSLLDRLEPVEQHYQAFLTQSDQAYADLCGRLTAFDQNRERTQQELDQLIDRAAQAARSGEDIVQGVQRNVDEVKRRFVEAETQLIGQVNAWLVDATEKAAQWKDSADSQSSEWRRTTEQLLACRFDEVNAAVGIMRQQLEASWHAWQDQEQTSRAQFQQELSGRFRDFEDRQFRKLEDIQQAYQLVANRQREAEETMRRQIDQLRAQTDEDRKVAQLAQHALSSEVADFRATTAAYEEDSYATLTKLRMGIIVLAVFLFVVAGTALWLAMRR